MQTSKIDRALTYQKQILPGVSRTFALTIPQLPATLQTSVTTAYLLCRIADTIEDDLNLGPEEGAQFQKEFVEVLNGKADVYHLVRHLYPRLSESTLLAERELVNNMAKVILVTNTLNTHKRSILIRCVEVMCELMPTFQHNHKAQGLHNLHQLNQYCYAVAGVVGEMLTELFCSYSDEIALRSGELTRLAPSFGQGLQMTNILKDLWEDIEMNSCWLPRDVFASADYDLSKLAPGYRGHQFSEGLEQLIAIAHGHLRNALEYSLLIPAHETGIRRFLLWNTNMAILTLRSIHKTPGFASADEVKISKAQLVGTVTLTSLCTRSDTLLRLLFDSFGRDVPLDSVDQQYFKEAAQLSCF